MKDEVPVVVESLDIYIAECNKRMDVLRASVNEFKKLRELKGIAEERLKKYNQRRNTDGIYTQTTGTIAPYPSDHHPTGFQPD